MKKHLLALSILCVIFLKSNAQSFQLLDTTGAAGGLGVTAQATYTINVDTSASGNFMFNVKNPTSSGITIKVKKYLISNPETDGISFCIGINCYTPLTTISSAVSISANSTLASGFLADFTAANVNNTASVLYTIFNTADTTDFISATINYNVSSSVAGIKQIANNYTISNIAPNPASTNVSLNYDLKNTSQPATIKIYNMLGTVIKTVSLDAYSNSTKIDITSLEEGMYFYSVVVGGKAVKTSRLIVSR